MAFLRSLPTKKHPTHKEIYGWGKNSGHQKGVVIFMVIFHRLDFSKPQVWHHTCGVGTGDCWIWKKKLIGKSEFKGAKRGCFSSLGFCGGIGVCILCFFLFHEIVKQEGCRNFQGGCKQHGWVVFYRFLIVFICLDHFESMGGDSEQI